MFKFQSKPLIVLRVSIVTFTSINFTIVSDPIGQRILSYLDEIGMSKASFAQKTGINKASLSHLEKGRNKASLSLVEAFAQEFPAINLHWLINGEGPKMRESSTPLPDHAQRTHSIEQAEESSEKDGNQELSKAIKPEVELEKEGDGPRTQSQPSVKMVHKESLTVLYPDGTYSVYRPRD